ncbi:uncharacterized protein LOC130891959 [Diorhabda carinulata]|uniref:uncharacterized protein LOC130891959 n=1 Tax=Diorhabda carinulata TaxID=1163345 RepID=UPI0025A05D6E|nr:uncharacterized protein LOC130891959 [Diorhabda carinulata]
MEDVEEPYKYPSEEISKEEEKDNCIYAAREEIIDRVMLEIDKIDRKQRIVTFIVDIACEALWRMMNIEFFHRTRIPDVSLPIWSGDCCSKPSPKDFLAAKTVPIRIQKELEMKLRESVPELICQCHPIAKDPCECLLTEDMRNLGALEELQKPPTPEQVSLESINSASSKTSSTNDEGEYSETYDQRALPSIVGDTSEESVVHKEVRCVLSEGFSKLRTEVNQIVLPKIDVTKPTREARITCLVELPDVRARITHDIQSDESEKKEKLKRKKDAERSARIKKPL